MKNKGLHQYRFQKNPEEKAFAEAWEKSNEHHRTLDYLLSKPSSTRLDEFSEPSKHDRQVAATVIQWLGSPVGQCFLEEVFEKIRQSKKPRRR